MRDTSRDDLRSDPDIPSEIRYDPDLAVHEPARVPEGPSEPSRRRSPLLLFPLALLLLAFGVYLLFGLIANERHSASDYLDEIGMGGGHAWEAAFELSRLLGSETRARDDARFVPRLLTLFEAARGGDPRVRQYLAIGLGEVGDPRAVEALIGAVDDGDLQTRINATLALGRLGDARAAPGILPLLDSDEPDLRKAAAYALGGLDAAESRGPLEALLNDPVEDVAWNAALALARRGDAAGLPLIVRMLDRRYLEGVARPDEAGRPVPLTEVQKEEAMINAMRSLVALRDRSQE